MQRCKTSRNNGNYLVYRSSNDNRKTWRIAQAFMLFVFAVFITLSFSNPVYADDDVDITGNGVESENITSEVNIVTPEPKTNQSTPPSEPANKSQQQPEPKSEPAINVEPAKQPEQPKQEPAQPVQTQESNNTSSQSSTPTQQPESTVQEPQGGNGNTSSDTSGNDSGQNDGDTNTGSTSGNDNTGGSGTDDSNTDGSNTDISGGNEGGNTDITGDEDNKTTDTPSEGEQTVTENDDKHEVVTDNTTNQTPSKNTQKETVKDTDASNPETKTTKKDTSSKKNKKVKNQKKKVKKSKKDKKEEVKDITSEVSTTTQSTSITSSYNDNTVITGDSNRFIYTPTGGYSAYSPYRYRGQTQSRSAWLKTLTTYQRLLVNMTGTTKNPAVINGDGTANIYEDKDENSRVVGTIDGGGICYILEEGDEWAYIESGEVRGFVKTVLLITGHEAEEIVTANTESSMAIGQTVVSPEDNEAFKYLDITTADIPTYAGNGSVSGNLARVNREDILEYAKQFLGRPYVWGGTDLWNGCDCSGFVQGVYGHFGIELPRVSRDQGLVGERIDARDAKPGDLLFYAEGGRIYHVIIYMGDGMSIQAHSSSRGIVITNVEYNNVCWGTRVIEDNVYTSTQAKDLAEDAEKAYAGDEEARASIIDALAIASEGEWNNYGFPRSVLIAQTIQESNWLSFQDKEEGGITPEDNNILGMNEELNNDEWESPWTGNAEERSVPQVEDGEVVYGDEMMRTYDDIESCIDDYAAFKTGMHPELQGETDVDIVIEDGLQGDATDPDYQSSIKELIDEYDLTQYDTANESMSVTGGNNNYSDEDLELIWALVAAKDDSSYEGALAVISSAANRAEQNYNGNGSDVLSQLKSDTVYGYNSGGKEYERRLGGNVPEYVKQAVEDCISKDMKSHLYMNLSDSNPDDAYVQIGSNYYY